jgi:hypothetical protein
VTVRKGPSAFAEASADKPGPVNSIRQSRGQKPPPTPASDGVEKKTPAAFRGRRLYFTYALTYALTYSSSYSFS